MKVSDLKNTEDLFKILKDYRKTTRYQFRGQSDSNWLLIPKVGRPPYNKRNDKDIFKQWKRRAYAYLDNKSLSEIELLTIAQHTGLPTRLLDWTYNPLVAVFFACTENQDLDGSLYAYKSRSYLSIADLKNPFNRPKGSVDMLQPNSSHSRLVNQFGYFTIHNGPNTELKRGIANDDLHKIIIPKNLKRDLLFTINQLGVNQMTIFPDLDGLSKHLCWFYENYEYWTEVSDNIPSPPVG
ncbi:FRG domain-containing protein [Gramella sp. AN32]|uniref:FRG domain-containing protein n=1 Tax=Christiangramia antarctica TaxID=2058158 RepID=A0ABW5XAK0_9FLAO|nr:FRG domain-containing protein [Gramella sp. AN32]MCM4157269.1 FRG domain-containing protein [Gramella sp. AN32]